ncbi:ABC transporter-related protein [Halovivax asiaticus JCM 14624]|uniref:ABC transporter-related protein n=1 Tax=Halovivax asiaticus JCM 14624 TaxID=1227490 RepID=M0BGC9_9EURY|nr:ABC transporter ATP-binding protein [Halovivax asiaticus]ELZ09951.1 ABC transporter-related protein [Halovivax asiaticus JCM 14624]
MHSESNPPSGTPLVDAQGVSRTYTRGRRSLASTILPWRDSPARPTVRALDAVSLSLDAGDVVGVAGPSGSGKSTLLEILAGLSLPDEGSIVVDGVDLRTLSPGERARHRLQRVGFVFQDFRLLESYSARTNVALPLVELGVTRRERRERATSLLTDVGLGDRLDHRPGALSGGERQRVAIARALAAKPAVVVADEPTGELDSDAGQRVRDLLRSIAAERAVVIASHDHETLADCDRVVQLRDGRRVDESVSSDASGHSTTSSAAPTDDSEDG